jgi:hypothetical protein
MGVVARQMGASAIFPGSPGIGRHKRLEAQPRHDLHVSQMMLLPRLAIGVQQQQEEKRANFGPPISHAPNFINYTSLCMVF